MVQEESYKAKIWKPSSSGELSEKDFPENNLLSDVFRKKKNVGIAINGGGMNAFATTIGLLAALSKLDLIRHVRYLSGTSGSSLPLVGFTYSPKAYNNDLFLGPIFEPKDLTLAKLKEMDKNCFRKVGNNSFSANFMDSLNFNKAFEETYFKPIGINKGQYFVYNSSFVDEIKKRNPSLVNASFLTHVNSDRPFLIIGSTMAGIDKSNFDLYTIQEQNYTYVEFTSLYSGIANSQIMTFKNNKVQVGGYIESFAFGSSSPNNNSLSKRYQTEGLVEVPIPVKPLGLTDTSALSSYLWGGLSQSSALYSILKWKQQYWSPADSNPKTVTANLGDGGSVCTSLMPLLQRRVKRIIAIFPTHMPILDKWNYTNNPINQTAIGPRFAELFGAIDKSFADVGMTFSNHVFNFADYFIVLKQLLKSRKEGNGLIGTFNLTTIKNVFWGIKKGFTVEITIIYEGRVTNWEKQLPSETYNLVVPKNSDDLGDIVASGPFSFFPISDPKTSKGLSTLTTTQSKCDTSIEMLNLRANLMSWIVLSNSELFKTAILPNNNNISPTTSPSSTTSSQLNVNSNTIRSNEVIGIIGLTLCGAVVILFLYFYIRNYYLNKTKDNDDVYIELKDQRKSEL